MRSKGILDRIKEKTPKEKVLKPPPSLETQLGFYVGEYIFYKFLPTLDVDGMTTRNVVKVSEIDFIEYQYRDNTWFDKVQSLGRGKKAPKEWNSYLSFRKYLQGKYLPHVLECHVPRIDVEDISSFKKGLARSLWDCDCCNYHIEEENITITQEEYFTVISLKLNTSFKLEVED